jgi:hypothetical protein
MNTRSDASMHMFFAKHDHELPVLNALARKGGVMKETTQEQSAAGVLFPGEFPNWVEEPRHGLVEADAVIQSFIKRRACRRISRAIREHMYRPGGPMYKKVEAGFKLKVI